MVLVYLKNGDCIEVEGTVSTLADNGTISCLDSHGQPVATFEAATVESVTSDLEVAEQMKEEVCEDLTVLPA